MEIEELIYLAGLFDGEGCISLNSSKSDKHASLHCAIQIAGSFIPKFYQSYFGGNVFAVKKVKTIHQQLWRWDIYSNKAIKFLNVIFPYLRIKRSETLIAFEYQAIINQHSQGIKLLPSERMARQELIKKMVALKRK